MRYPPKSMPQGKFTLNEPNDRFLQGTIQGPATRVLLHTKEPSQTQEKQETTTISHKNLGLTLPSYICWSKLPGPGGKDVAHVEALYPCACFGKTRNSSFRGIPIVASDSLCNLLGPGRHHALSNVFGHELRSHPAVIAISAKPPVSSSYEPKVD